MTGITAAIYLKQAGRTVAVVDTHHVGTGESGHTTAHITEVIDTRYHKLLSDFGLNGARVAAESNRSAIGAIDQLVTQHGLECDFRRVPAYLYAEDQAGKEELEKEYEAARKIGLKVSREKEPPIAKLWKNHSIRSALRFEDQAAFHPRKYLLGLARAIQGQGSHIFEKSHVKEIREGTHCHVITDQGEIISRDVIVATNSPISNRFTLHTKNAAYRTYAIAFPAPESHKFYDALYWDTQDPYHYIRQEKVGDELYWIVGGEDHKTGMERDTQDRFDRLIQYSKNKFNLKDIDLNKLYRWSGQIIEPADGLPYIGKNPGDQHTYIATGYAGNGMTFSTVAGLLLTDLILGMKTPWAKLYSPSRIKPLASAMTFLEENKDYPLCMIKDRITPAEASSVAEVKPGEGKIVRVKGKKTAVYRAEDGTVQALSPICTHLGCYVAFNNSEKSWDCPCHGSRFSTDGKVINGPTKAPLKPINLEVEEESEKKDSSEVA